MHIKDVLWMLPEYDGGEYFMVTSRSSSRPAWTILRHRDQNSVYQDSASAHRVLRQPCFYRAV